MKNIQIEKFYPLLIGLIYTSFYFIGPLYTTHFVVDILPFDIILTIIAGVLIIKFFLEGSLKPKIKLFPRFLIIPLIIFSFILSIDVLRASLPFAVITLLVANTRNFLLAWLLIVLIKDSRESKEKVGEYLIFITAFISTISLIMYFINSFSLKMIKPVVALWHPGIWYFLSEGKIMRLSGVASDPNFFLAISIIGFVYSLFYFNKNIKYKIASLTILIAIIFTISKMALVVLAALFFVGCALFILKRREESLKVIRNYIFVVLLSMPIFFVAGFISKDFNVYQMYKARIYSAAEFVDVQSPVLDTRTSLWQTGYEIFSHNPIFGAGGKAAFFERKEYLHNDYLEMMSSYGLIGLAALMFFLGATLVMSYRNLFMPLVTESFFLVICYSVFMLGFSVFFNPFLFFVLGLLWAGIGSGQKELYDFSNNNNVR
jgi:O-antigen ligase